jgi:hypothetical protein
MSTYSPAFIAAAKRPIGWLKLGVRLPLLIALAPISLLAVLLKGLGQLGEFIYDWHDHVRHEIAVLTLPPVWTELTALSRRCSAAEERLRLLGATVNEEPLS